MGGFGTEQKVGVEIDGRVDAAGAIHADGDRGARVVAEVAVHAQRDGDVVRVSEEDAAHRDGLQRLLRHLAQHCGGVQPDLGAFGGRERRAVGGAVVAEDVVQRRQQIGVAEALDDDAVDARDLAVHRMGRVDPDDRPDADGRVERGPEVKLVRRVRLALGGDDAAERVSVL